MASSTTTGVGPAEFLRRLVQRGEVPQVRTPVKRVEFEAGSEPPRVAWIEDFLPKATEDWLVRSGGFRARLVGAKRDARLYDPFVWDKLGYRFGAATLRLAYALAEWATGIDGGVMPTVTPQLVEGAVPRETGDIVAFHLMLEPIIERLLGFSSSVQAEEDDGGPDQDLDADEEDDEDATKAKKGKKGKKAKARRRSGDDASGLEQARILIAASPLTALIHAEDLPPPANAQSRSGWAAGVKAAAARVAPLVEGGRAFLLTYLDDLVARAWIDREESRRSVAPDHSAARYLALAATIEGLVSASTLADMDAVEASDDDEADRPDALRPVLRFFERYIIRFGPRRETITEKLREKRDDRGLFPKLSDHDAYLKDLARLFGSFGAVRRVAERVIDTPFPDRTDYQRAFIADYQDRLGRVAGTGPSLADEIDLIRRTLEGEVG